MNATMNATAQSDTPVKNMFIGSDMLTSRQRGFEVVPDEYRTYPDEEIRLPKRATGGSACYDVYSPASVYIAPHSRTIISTDVRAYMQPGEALLAYPRSSMGKIPMRLANGTGVIDSDYYGNATNGGNIAIMLHNLSDETIDVRQGDRICQMMFVPCLLADDDTADTVREGGWGSTGM